MRTRRVRPSLARSAFTGFCFPPEVIVLAVRWYLRFALSYRDVEELLAERGVEVDHVTVYRWVLRFTPLLAEAARPCRHAVGDRWQVDETYVKVAGQWRYVYRAIDQFGQVIDVFVSPRRDTAAARRFFERAIGTTRVTPIEVTTDRAAAYPAVLDDLLPATWHRTDQYANNRIECDHGRLKARLRPMRGLKQDRSATVRQLPPRAGLGRAVAGRVAQPAPGPPAHPRIMAQSGGNLLLGDPAQGPDAQRFTDLGELRQRLLGFQRRYQQTAVPFDWRYTRADLDRLLHRLDGTGPVLLRPDHHARASIRQCSVMKLVGGAMRPRS